MFQLFYNLVSVGRRRSFVVGKHYRIELIRRAHHQMIYTPGSRVPISKTVVSRPTTYQVDSIEYGTSSGVVLTHSDPI